MAMIKKCLACEGEFKVPPNRYSTAKFCSQQCAVKNKSTLLTKTCPVCETQYKTSPSRDTNFCSVKCRAKSRIKKYDKNCLFCNKEFRTTPSLNGSFCSKTCADTSRRKYIIKNCASCQKEFESSALREKKFCSVECSYEDKRNKATKNCIVCHNEYKVQKTQVGRSKFCSKVCFNTSKTSGFKYEYNMKQLTESFIDNIDYENLLTLEIDEADINSIFKLDIINTIDIADDVNVFSLKKN